MFSYFADLRFLYMTRVAAAAMMITAIMMKGSIAVPDEDDSGTSGSWLYGEASSVTVSGSTALSSSMTS